MNVANLRLVRDEIAKPKTVFSMENWRDCFSGHATLIQEKLMWNGPVNPDLIMFHLPVTFSSPSVSDPEGTTFMTYAYVQGRNFLGLTSEEARKLFFTKNWPRQFISGLKEVKVGFNTHHVPTTTKELALERLDWFIATDGTDKLELDPLDASVPIATDIIEALANDQGPPVTLRAPAVSEQATEAHEETLCPV